MRVLGQRAGKWPRFAMPVLVEDQCLGDRTDCRLVACETRFQPREYARRIDFMSSKPARNSPCPCGSGKKYKQCCGRNAVTPDSSATPAARPRSWVVKNANKLLASGNLKDAWRGFESLLKDDPHDPDGLTGKGKILLIFGRASEARPLLQRAAGPKQRSPEVFAALASACMQDLDPEAAVEALDRAIAIDPSTAQLHGARAVALIACRRTDEAALTAERALAIDPVASIAATAHVRLLRRGGDNAGAIESANRFDAILPAGAIDDLSQIRTEAAMSLESLGEFDEAWRTFDEANQLHRKIPEFGRLDLDLYPERIRASRAALDSDELPTFEPADLADDSPPPGFLVGFPRSGTTLIEQILGAHPGIVTSNERPIMQRVRETLVGGDRSDRTGAMDRLKRLTLSDAKALRSKFRRIARGWIDDADGRHILVHKQPMDLCELALIRTIFPDGRLIIALRDPRDVVVSCFKQSFTPNPAMAHFTTLEGTANLYRSMMDLWLSARGNPGMPALELRYEDLVADFQSWARRLIDFAGAPWDPVVLEFYSSTPKHFIATPSAMAVTRPVNRDAVGRWERYRTFLAPALPIIEPFVSAFGYPPSTS